MPCTALRVYLCIIAAALLNKPGGADTLDGDFSGSVQWTYPLSQDQSRTETCLHDVFPAVSALVSIGSLVGVQVTAIGHHHSLRWNLTREEIQTGDYKLCGWKSGCSKAAPPVAQMSWKTMSSTQQVGAAALGWGAFGNGYGASLGEWMLSGDSPRIDQEVLWAQRRSADRCAAMLLGWCETSWDAWILSLRAKSGYGDANATGSNAGEIVSGQPQDSGSPWVGSYSLVVIGTWEDGSTWPLSIGEVRLVPAGCPLEISLYRPDLGESKYSVPRGVWLAVPGKDNGSQFVTLNEHVSYNAYHRILHLKKQSSASDVTCIQTGALAGLLRLVTGSYIIKVGHTIRVSASEWGNTEGPHLLWNLTRKSVIKPLCGWKVGQYQVNVTVFSPRDKDDSNTEGTEPAIQSVFKLVAVVSAVTSEFDEVSIIYNTSLASTTWITQNPLAMEGKGDHWSPTLASLYAAALKDREPSHTTHMADIFITMSEEGPEKTCLHSHRLVPIVVMLDRILSWIQIEAKSRDHQLSWHVNRTSPVVEEGLCGWRMGTYDVVATAALVADADSVIVLTAVVHVAADPFPEEGRLGTAEPVLPTPLPGEDEGPGADLHAGPAQEEVGVAEDASDLCRGRGCRDPYPNPVTALVAGLVTGVVAMCLLGVLWWVFWRHIYVAKPYRANAEPQRRDLPALFTPHADAPMSLKALALSTRAAAAPMGLARSPESGLDTGAGSLEAAAEGTQAPFLNEAWMVGPASSSSSSSCQLAEARGNMGSEREPGARPEGRPWGWGEDRAGPPFEAMAAAGPMLGLQEVELVHQLGTFGQVYKAVWNGATVTVKVVELAADRGRHASILNELEMARTLRHPNILTTFDSAAFTDQPPDQAHPTQFANGVFDMVHWQSVTTLEYTEGDLAGALESGLLREPRPDGPPGVCLPRALSALADVAKALTYVHSINIAHGDLKAENVMYTWQVAPGQAVGQAPEMRLCAKLANFGLSQAFRPGGEVVGGTLTHLSPEALQQRVTSPAADVFAYGVLIWQLCEQQRPFADLRNSKGEAPQTPHEWQAMVVEYVLHQDKRLVFQHQRPRFSSEGSAAGSPDPGEEARYNALCTLRQVADGCWRREAPCRLTAPELLLVVEAMELSPPAHLPPPPPADPAPPGRQGPDAADSPLQHSQGPGAAYQGPAPLPPALHLPTLAPALTTPSSPRGALHSREKAQSAKGKGPAD